jgi:hypothetical protein
MSLTEERIGENDATFRAANERIRDAAEEYEMSDGVPFICECADERCRAVLTLSLAEYEELRRDPRTFLNVPGHEAAARGAARVLSRNERYVVVEKTGRAGEVAEELDPRTAA